MKLRHFLQLSDFNSDELELVIQRAIEGKKQLQEGNIQQTLKGKVLAMIFEKSSTRTRVSFETAMAQSGGHAIFLAHEGTQLGVLAISGTVTIAIISAVPTSSWVPVAVRKAQDRNRTGDSRG